MLPLQPEARRLFRATFDQAAVGIAHVAPSGRFVRVNDRYCKIAGYSREEMLACSFQQITHPDDLETNLTHLKALLAGDADSTTFEKRYVRQDGGSAWINLTVAVVRDEAGSPDFFVTIAEDISARKATEAQLHERDALLQGISEAVPGMVYAKDRSGRVLYTNPSTAAVVGRPVDQIIGFTDADWIPDPEQAKAIMANDRSIMASGQAQTLEEAFTSPEGRTSHWLATKAPLRGPDGAVIGIVGVSTDITALKAAEEKLGEALKAKELLLYEVNHRVKNSLQMVTSLMLIEASKIKDPEARAVMMGARQKVATIAQLHQRLYTEGSHDAVDFVAFLQDLSEKLLRATGSDDRLAIEVNGDACPLPMCTAGPLSMIANELATNALKHALPTGSGRIALNVQRAGGSVSLTVSDNGVGLPAGFDPAAAVSVGMKVVTGLVQQLGGALDIGTGSGGATFRVEVPIGQPA